MRVSGWGGGVVRWDFVGFVRGGGSKAVDAVILHCATQERV